MAAMLRAFGMIGLCGALAAAEEASGAVITAEVDWVQETIRGGSTAVALIILIIAGITLCVERLWNLRAKHIAPMGLADEVLPLWSQGKYDSILKACDRSDSALGRMIRYLVDHRTANPELLIPGASDIGTRELRVHAQKSFALAVIAALAPLLGLLGTMIGMIESFKLVEQFGDEGGASMLAGSISKALITTALGLIIAIPCLGIYHFLKYRITQLGVLLDEELEMLVNNWLLIGAEPPAAVSSGAESAHSKPKRELTPEERERILAKRRAQAAAPQKG